MQWGGGGGADIVSPFFTIGSRVCSDICKFLICICVIFCKYKYCFPYDFVTKKSLGCLTTQII